MVAVSPLTTISAAMIWWSGCRSSIRSSFPARGVETQNDLDDRALPDRLCLLHRNLDGHEVAPVLGNSAVVNSVPPMVTWTGTWPQ